MGAYQFKHFNELVWATPLTPKIISTAIVILVFIFIHRLTRFLVARRFSDPMVRQGYWDLSRNINLFLTAAIIGGVWLDEMKTVSLLLTGLMAAFLIAAKELVLGFAGRLSLATSHHFRAGDRIQINGICGDVIDIGILFTWLAEVGGPHGENQSTGKVVVIPNLWLTLHPVSNYTHIHDYLWDEMDFTFPAEIDLEKVMEFLRTETAIYMADEIELAQRRIPRISKEYAVRVPPATPIVYVRLEKDPSGRHVAVLTLRFITEARARRGQTSNLTLHLLELLRKKRIPLVGMNPTPGTKTAKASPGGRASRRKSTALSSI